MTVRVVHATIPAEGTEGEVGYAEWAADHAITGLEAYITDAPSDGKAYVRMNGEWVEYPLVTPESEVLLNDGTALLLNDGTALLLN